VCLNVPEANVSAMLLGDKRIICKEYHDIDEMKEKITKFLSDVNKH
jgi:hypothetical protein